MLAVVVAGGVVSTTSAVGVSHLNTGPDRVTASFHNQVPYAPAVAADPDQICNANPEKCLGNPIEVLPVFRWENLPDFQNRNKTNVSLKDLPITGIMNSFLTNFATFLMSVANWIWRITIFCIFLGTSNNWLKQSTYTISAFVLRIGPVGWTGVAVAWFVLLWRASKMSLKGNLTGILRSIAVFMLPVGMFAYVYNGASTVIDRGQPALNAKNDELRGARGVPNCAGTPDDGAYDISSCKPEAIRAVSEELAGVPGNPVWLATTIGDHLETFFGEVSLQIMTAGNNEGLVQAALGRAGSGDGEPNCAGYIQALFNIYDSRKGNDTADIAKAVSVKHVNALYRVAAEASWGETTAVNYVPCHEFEDGNSVPMLDRQFVMGVAYPNLKTSTNPPRNDLEAGELEEIAAGHPAVYELVLPGSYSIAESRAQLKYGGVSDEGDARDLNLQKEEQLRYLNWAACLHNGTRWYVNWEWIAIGNTSLGKQDGMDAARMRDYYDTKGGDNPQSSYCTNRWNTGHKDIDEQLGEVDPNEVTRSTNKHGVNSFQAREMIRHWNGERPMPRIVLGLTSIGAAVAYLLMLGGPAIGLLAVTIGLILLLAFFPITLALYAAQAKAGGKMLRMTVSFIGAKAMFLVLLGLIVAIEMILGAVISSIDSTITQAGFISSLLQILTPIAVLVLVNKLMQAIGLGKLTSIKGSLGALGDLSSKAMRAQSMSSFMGGLAGAGKKSARFAKKGINKTKSGSRKAIGKFKPNSRLLKEGRRDNRELARLKRLEKEQEKSGDTELLKATVKKRTALESKMKQADMKAADFRNKFKPSTWKKGIKDAGGKVKDFGLDAADKISRLDSASVMAGLRRAANKIGTGAVKTGAFAVGAAGAAAAMPLIGIGAAGAGLVGIGAAVASGLGAKAAANKWVLGRRGENIATMTAELEAGRAGAGFDDEFARTVRPDELVSNEGSVRQTLRGVAQTSATATKGLSGSDLTNALEKVGRDERRTVAQYLNPDGIPLSDAQINTVARVKANEWGVQPSQVLVSSDGLAMLDPTIDVSTIRNPELMGRPELHIDTGTVGAMFQNTATTRDRADKLAATLAVAGLYRTDKTQVIVEDVMAMNQIAADQVLTIMNDPSARSALTVSLDRGNVQVQRVQMAIQQGFGADYTELLATQLQRELDLRLDIAPAIEAIDSAPGQMLGQLADITVTASTPRPQTTDAAVVEAWNQAQRASAQALQSVIDQVAELVPVYTEFGGHIATVNNGDFDAGVAAVEGQLNDIVNRIRDAASSLNTNDASSVQRVADLVAGAMVDLDRAARDVLPIDILKARVNELGVVRREIPGPDRPPRVETFV